MIRAAGRVRIHRIGLMLAAGALLVTRRALAQCAMCGSAVGSSNRLGFGLNVSIFFLLAVLAALVGGLIVLAVRSGRVAAPHVGDEGVSLGDGGATPRT